MAPSAACRSNAGIAAEPTPLQIAFALAIVKSKPDQVTVREYISNLRRHLKTDPLYRQQLSQWQLDQITFWRSEYARADDAKNLLQARVSDLERKLENLDASNQSPSVSRPTQTIKGKRKDPEPLILKFSKKLKPSSPSNQTLATEGLQQTVHEDWASVHASSEGASLVRTIFTASKLCEEDIVDPPRLGHSLAQIALSIGAILTAMARQDRVEAAAGNDPARTGLPGPVLAKRKADADYAHVVRAIARAFSTLLYGLSKLPQDRGAEDMHAHVIYSCVKMFQAALKAITQSAEARAASISSMPVTRSSKTGTTQTKAKTSQPKNDLGRVISQFLNACLLSLNADEVSHSAIFEGFMYALLERVGARLYTCTFDHERSPTIEGDIQVSYEETFLSEQKIDTLKLEIPCLISVLEKALGLAPRLLGRPAPTASKAKGKSRQATVAKTPSSVTKFVLGIDAKERLQQTLVNCMFGTDPASTALDCLRQPLPKSRIPVPPQDAEQHISDWFRQEVWRLVGWEILGREQDW